jgi:TatD DNase family protein
MMIDVHFHPLEEVMDRDTVAVMARARAVGVEAAISAAWDRASIEATVALCARCPGVVGAVGYHPWFVTPEDDLALLSRVAADPHIVAIGEIGLDGKVATPLQTQATLFANQLELARSLSLPAVVHSRYAFAATYDVMKPFSGMPAVMHSFGGSIEMAKKFLDLGCYFSFSGSVTRPGAKRVHALASYIPLDRLLLETDAPSIAIEGVDARAVEPCHLPLVARQLGYLRGLTTDEMGQQTAENTMVVFGARLTRCCRPRAAR